MRTRRLSRRFNLRQTLVWACVVGFGFGIVASPSAALLDHGDQPTRLVGTVLGQAALPGETIGRSDREGTKPGQPNAACFLAPHRSVDRLPLGDGSFLRSGKGWRGQTSLTALGVRLQI
ncbi:hypothetical protein [Stieleria neptunia]|uniref:hypothetical protein n=1 Tax=Stieleria neptunia TaxID=2527979 RepID=UPI0011A93E4D|nr:hypothetical protein [Stieleria neptunia]